MWSSTSRLAIVPEDRPTMYLLVFAACAMWFLRRAAGQAPYQQPGQLIGDVKTIAGSSLPGSADGLGLAAQFFSPLGVALASNGSFALVVRCER